MAAKKVVVTEKIASNAAKINVLDKEDYVNEVKKFKMENLVREINKAHSTIRGWGSKSIVPAGLLRLIFHYDELNEFGKIIVNNAEFAMPGTTDYKIGSRTRLNAESEKTSERQWIAKEWVTYCRGKVNSSDQMGEAFYFIFWSLMVLSVDGREKEEKLSIICDFARMFMLTDDEIKDILQIIKIIYDRSDSEVLCKKSYSISYGTEQYEELRKKQYMELDKYIKSDRTLKAFDIILETYTGISGDNMLEYRQFGRVY